MKSAAATDAGVVEGRAIAERLLNRLHRNHSPWGTYALDLALDAMLEIFLAGGDARFKEFVFAVVQRRNGSDAGPLIAGRLPFGHLDHTIYRCTEDRRLLDHIVDEARHLRASVARSPDGLVMHCDGQDAPPRVLVDFMQDYIARMARAGVLTGQMDFLDEAATQTLLHRDLLRQPDTGLWRQGRGWESDDPKRLSPGAWSRGQGWVLRGLLDAMDAMPWDCAPRRVLRGCLIELLEALLPRQDSDGYWHCLVDRDFAESNPETSGTALIAAALYRSLADGHVSGERYRDAADRALAAVARQVDGEGRIAGACAGPGPLNRELHRRYLGASFPEAEDHGIFSVLYLCAAREQIECRRGR